MYDNDHSMVVHMAASAVTKSGTGTWDGDVGRGRGTGTWDAGTRGRVGTRGSE